MWASILACGLLLVASTAVHYEALHRLDRRLPSLPGPRHARLVAAVVGAFAAHALEVVLYGLAYRLLVVQFGAGGLGSVKPALATCLYFSAETYTSLGFGDLTPSGPLRLVAGFEALNGLLLVGWSASFIHLGMERYWAGPAAAQRPAATSGAAVRAPGARRSRRGAADRRA